MVVVKGTTVGTHLWGLAVVNVLFQLGCVCACVCVLYCLQSSRSC